MRGQLTLIFRDVEMDVVVDEYTVEYDTNCCIIEWHFHGLKPEDHDALDVTDAEEDAIVEKIHQHMTERT